MRRPLFLALIVVGLLAVSALGVAAPDRSERSERSDRSEGRGPPGSVPAPLGAFLVEESSKAVTGRHLSFAYSDAGIDDFHAGNRTLFSIVVEGDEDGVADVREDAHRAAARTEGSSIRVRAPNFTLVSHDNPSATSKLEADGSITVIFEEGVMLVPREGAVRFSFGDVAGVLRGEDLTIEARTVVASDDILVFLEVPRGAFDKHRARIGAAIARGHVGAEATFNALDNDVEQEVVSYGNVTMTTLKAERGNLTLLIDGHGQEGRVLVLNVDGRVIGADAADKLSVSMDNMTIVQASNLTDILDPDDDGFSPEYYPVYDVNANAFQLIVTVPHYSVHTLSVTLVELLTPSVVIGVLAGVALLVPTGLLLFRRK